MAIWTVTNVGVNNTDTDLYPVRPNSAATWYGSIETNPETISKQNNNGQAGKFRATSGTATGVTAISVYVSPDPSKAIFFLIMMPYGTGEVNETKVGFIDVTSHIDKELIKRLWNDGQFGTGASYSFSSGSTTVRLSLESKIDQGTNVQATFTLAYQS